jgi:hypothetical protein
MRFFDQNKILFARLGLLFFLITVVLLLVIFIEFLVGNGDGVWFDYDLRVLGFKLISWMSGALALYLLARYSPPLVQNLLLSLVSVVFLIYAAETVVGWIHSASQKPAVTTTPQYAGPAYDSSYAFDEFLGRKPIPNHVFKWVKTLNGKPAISIDFTVDSLSRRVTPAVDSATRTQYGLFLGCSFTYGDAVRDNETIPYFFQKQNADFQTYNYGFFGYSPRHALARFQHQDIAKQVTQKQGFAVYTFIDDHINRAIPSVGWIGMYDGFFPDIDEKTMQTTGVYRLNHPLKYRAGMMIFKSKIRQHYGMDFPFVYRPQDYELTANLLKATQEAYQKQFGNNRFYVALYPDQLKKDSPMPKLLQERGIKVLDYRKLFPFPSKQYQCTYDGHPNPEAHRLFAAQLAKDLQILQTPK